MKGPNKRGAHVRINTNFNLCPKGNNSMHTNIHLCAYLKMFPQESLVGQKFRKGSNLYLHKIKTEGRLVVGTLSKKTFYL